MAKLVYYAILLITLQIAFGVWGPNPVSALLTSIVAWLPRAVVGIIIVVVAALNQIGVATTVTTPVLIAVLASIAGVIIVGVGGGLVGPMQRRWERWLDRAEQEAPRVREHVQAGRGASAATRSAPAAQPPYAPGAGDPTITMRTHEPPPGPAYGI